MTGKPTFPSPVISGFGEFSFPAFPISQEIGQIGHRITNKFEYILACPRRKVKCISIFHHFSQNSTFSEFHIVRKDESQKNQNIFCVSLVDTSLFFVPFATIFRIPTLPAGTAAMVSGFHFAHFLPKKNAILSVSFRSGRLFFSFHFRTRALYNLYISSAASRAFATMAFSLGKQ